jgi:hypothetical protein
MRGSRSGAGKVSTIGIASADSMRQPYITYRRTEQLNKVQIFISVRDMSSESLAVIAHDKCLHWTEY